MSPIYDALGVSGRACCRTCSPTRRSSARTRATWCTAPTRSSASTTCATTWPRTSPKRSSAATPFAIVDEVDNILIDEARTPLIISGAPEQAADLYVKFARLAPQMVAGKTPEGMDPRTQEAVHGRLRLRDRREAQDGVDHRAGRRQGGALPRHRPPVPRRERASGQPPDPGAAGRVAVQARRRLRGDRRRGQDHRRVHRAHPRRQALVGGPAPGGRGQGGRVGPGGEPDARRRSPTRTTSACTTSSRA